METPKKIPLPERNPKTHAEHRREVFWQITLPMVIGVLMLLVALASIIVLANQSLTDLSRVADVSIIWMILPSLILALIILVMLIGVVYAIISVLRVFPPYARIVQLYFERGKGEVSRTSNKITEPIIRMHSISAAARRLGRLGNKKVKDQ